MKYAPKTISLPEKTLERGIERANRFKINFSQYVAILIDEEYRSGREKITIVLEADGHNQNSKTSWAIRLAAISQ